jgi:N-formylmaleamate deformylase
VPMMSEWRAMLDKVECPALLIYGDPERGGIVDGVKANQVAAQIKYGEAAFIPNAGHSIHRDEHDAFMAEVNAFLQVT